MLTVRAGRRLRERSFVLAALILVTLGTGCSAATGEGANRPSRSSGDELTGEEVRASTGENLYDAIRAAEAPVASAEGSIVLHDARVHDPGRVCE